MKTTVTIIGALAISLTVATAVAADVLKFRQIKSWEAGVTGPIQREHPVLFFDAQNSDKLFLFGGQDFSNPQNSTNDLWTLDLKTETWKLVAQKGMTPGSLGRIAAIPGTKYNVYYGGMKDGIPSGQVFRFSLTGDVANWEKLEMPGFAGGVPISLGSLAFDLKTNSFVTACGVSDEVTCRVLRIIPSLSKQIGWQLIEADGPQPDARYGFAYAYDQVHSRMVIASGQNQPTEVNGQPVFDQTEDTWSLSISADNKTIWTKLGGPQAPKRRNGCWAHDTDKNQLYMWGGTADGKTTIEGLYKLDLNDDAKGWSKIETNNLAPIRSSCIGVYDSKRKRILFGFGNTMEKTYADLWELKL